MRRALRLGTLEMVLPVMFTSYDRWLEAVCIDLAFAPRCELSLCEATPHSTASLRYSTRLNASAATPAVALTAMVKTVPVAANKTSASMDATTRPHEAYHLTPTRRRSADLRAPRTKPMQSMSTAMIPKTDNAVGIRQPAVLDQTIATVITIAAAVEMPTANLLVTSIPPNARRYCHQP